MRWNKVERLRAQDGNIQVRTNFKSEKAKVQQKKNKEKQHAQRRRMTEHSVEVSNEDQFYLDFRTSSSTSATTSVMVGRS